MIDLIGVKMPVKTDGAEGHYAKYAMGKSKNTGDDWEIDIFRVGPDTKNCGFKDDDLEDGWYWFCQADIDNGVWNINPGAAIRGPFSSEADAVKDADSMGVK